MNPQLVLASKLCPKNESCFFVDRALEDGGGKATAKPGEARRRNGRTGFRGGSRASWRTWKRRPGRTQRRWQPVDKLMHVFIIIIIICVFYVIFE